MIRTQHIRLLWSPDGLPSRWCNYLIDRDHAFGNHVAHSEMLVCPRCHEAWAYLIFHDEADCWPTAQFCSSCDAAKYDWYPVPGSILIEEGYGVIDTSLLAALPKELIEREFKLHLKAYSP